MRSFLIQSILNRTHDRQGSYLLKGVSVLMLCIFTYIGFTGHFTVEAVTDITTCQTISSAGNYRLTSNIGSGGTCITATVSGVDIDGADFTLNGDIVADAPDSASSGLQISLRNITVQGHVYARGYQSTSTGTSGGSVTAVDTVIQGNIYVTGGAGMSHSQAALGEVALTGGIGGVGGTVSLTDVQVNNIYASGGDGAAGQRGFTGDELGTVYGGGGGNGGNGGNGGQIEALRTTISGVAEAIGGYPGIGGNGGDGFSGTPGADSSTTDAAGGNNGGQAGLAGIGGIGGNGGTVTLTDSSAVTVSVDARGGGSGGNGGVGGTGGNGGAALITGINAGHGGTGGNGGVGGEGGNAGNAGTVTVLRSTVGTINALGGGPGPVGGGGNGGPGGNGGDASNAIGGGTGGNGGNGGTGGATGQYYGQSGNGGNVTVTDSGVTNVNIAAGQPGSPSVEGQGGAAGVGGSGASSAGYAGNAGNNGSYTEYSPSAGNTGSLSLLNNPPSIQLTGANPMSVTVGSSFVDPGATVTDGKDKNLTATVSGTVNVAVLGEYTLTYSVTDNPIAPLIDGVLVPEYVAAARSDVKTRIVRVVEQTVPLLQPVTPAGGQTPGGFSSSEGLTQSQIKSEQGQGGDIGGSDVAQQVFGKITEVFSSAKNAVEILNILMKSEVVDLLSGELSKQETKPFDNSQADNLKLLGETQCPVFTKTILSDVPRQKENNTEEVKKWQRFYNTMFGANLKVDGVYNAATINETYRFQRVFKNAVLGPWGLEDPTGNISVTTRYAANTIIGCNK